MVCPQVQGPRVHRSHSMEEGEREAGAVALVPCPPGAAAGPSGAPSRGAGRGTASSSPSGEYGRMVGGCAVFNPDDAFFAACKNKGITDPVDVFRQKTLADFTDADGKALAEALAERRLESYDLLRARMMAIVLTERERLLSQGASPGTSTPQTTLRTPAPPGGCGSGQRPHTVASLRPPRGLRNPEQMDVLAAMSTRLERSKKRAEYDQRTQAFIKHRAEEELLRQEAAHKELKIRHILSDLQRREIAKVNERILAGRQRRADTAREVRQRIRHTWEEHSTTRLHEISEKAEANETHLERIQGDRSQWLAERSKQRAAKIARAKALRASVDEERQAKLCAKVDKREQACVRKERLDKERVQGLHERRTLEDAYRQQVVGISENLRQIKEHTVLSQFEKKTARSDCLLRGATYDAFGRPDGHSEASVMKRHKIVMQKERLARAAQEQMEERLASREVSMAAAEENRHAQNTMKAEVIKLSCERKQAMAQRTQREQMEHQRQLQEAIQAKHAKSAQRMRVAAEMKRAIAQQTAALNDTSRSAQ
eukprot:TRINITY_DN2601_c0_g1_i1.p1 TRINITY_DN2601_c0_g1~~TRINITY_DN2601_c0_g1_i1.p1  ORF type:complete len:542 (+),score=144.37 TRINITY_DN2601_c0_g1_i1:17-1642(+)